MKYHSTKKRQLKKKKNKHKLNRPYNFFRRQFLSRTAFKNIILLLHRFPHLCLKTNYNLDATIHHVQ